MQSVRAVGKWIQQGPVGHGKLAGGVVARAQGALVTGGGGGEIGLDGEQMGILCVNNRSREKERERKKTKTDRQLCESP